MYVLYLVHRGLNYILGKTITEQYSEELEMKFQSSNLKTKDEDDFNDLNGQSIFTVKHFLRKIK